MGITDILGLKKELEFRKKEYENANYNYNIARDAYNDAVQKYAKANKDKVGKVILVEGMAIKFKKLSSDRCYRSDEEKFDLEIFEVDGVI